MSKILGKVFNIILDVIIAIVIFILIIAIYNFVQVKIQKKEYANILGYSIFEVTTGSMSGTIEIGDFIVTKNLEKNDIVLKENDIIVFKQDNVIITHRIVKIEGQTIVTKGDANNTEDAPINKKDVIGKVEKIISNVAIWKKTFTTPKVYISMFFTFTLFSIAFCINTEENTKIKDSNNTGENNYDR